MPPGDKRDGNGRASHVQGRGGRRRGTHPGLLIWVVFLESNIVDYYCSLEF